METQLLAFGTHQARISAADKAGVPARAHMEKRLLNLRRQFGADSEKVREAEAALSGPRVGAGERRVWHLYLAVQRWRGAGGMSASPITLHDIEAFERRYGVHCTAWECDCIKALDLAFLATRDP